MWDSVSERQPLNLSKSLWIRLHSSAKWSIRTRRDDLLCLMACSMTLCLRQGSAECAGCTGDPAAFLSTSKACSFPAKMALVHKAVGGSAFKWPNKQHTGLTARSPRRWQGKRWLESTRICQDQIYVFLSKDCILFFLFIF